MKGCIVGVGAIGGLIGAKLAASGHAHVSALSRGAALQAIRRHGWRLITANEAITAPARVTDNPEELGTQDPVILAIKAPALATAVASLRPMLEIGRASGRGSVWQYVSISVVAGTLKKNLEHTMNHNDQ